MNLDLDQHFLIDENILNKTINTANINSDDIIFEIGPGAGVLTKKILKQNPKKLISIEKDENLKKYLEQIKQNNSNFQFIISDGTQEINNFKFTKLIANIPYSITEPLYKKILDKKIEFALMLHGKKFYDIITMSHNKWYHFVNAFYNIELIEEVNGDKFEPKTKVKSALVLLKLKQNLTQQNILLQTLYSKRTRNLKNAIIYTFVDINKTKKEAKEIFDKLKIDITLHDKLLDNLSNEEFLNILKSLQIFLK